MFFPPFALFTLSITERLHGELNSTSPSPLKNLEFDHCVNVCSVQALHRHPGQLDASVCPSLAGVLHNAVMTEPWRA